MCMCVFQGGEVGNWMELATAECVQPLHHLQPAATYHPPSVCRGPLEDRQRRHLTHPDGPAKRVSHWDGLAREVGVRGWRLKGRQQGQGGGGAGSVSGHMEPACHTKSWCHVCSLSTLSLSVPARPNFSPHGCLGYSAPIMTAMQRGGLVPVEQALRPAAVTHAVTRRDQHAT